MDSTNFSMSMRGRGAFASVQLAESTFRIFSTRTSSRYRLNPYMRGEVSWLRLITDVPTAFSDIAHGYLSIGDYIRSRLPALSQFFSFADPLPFIAEAVLLPYLVARKYPVLSLRKST